ncbi:MAG: hypothetical protein J0L62_10730 [Bacteroidetes bacterium]|nr:hypothetical protein [Bacteroidota bacterium]
MIFPWSTVLGLLIQHGPTLVTKVKKVITNKTEVNKEASLNERIHRLETVLEQISNRNDELQQEINQIREENYSLQKIVQWLVFYVVVVSLVGLLWIIFSIIRS